jgi:hypothetical protein
MIVTTHFAEDALAKKARIFEERYGDTLRMHRIEIHVGQLEGIVNELAMLPRGVRGLGFICRDYTGVQAISSIFRSMTDSDALASVPYRAESYYGGSAGNGASYGFMID